MLYSHLIAAAVMTLDVKIIQRLQAFSYIVKRVARSLCDSKDSCYRPRSRGDNTFGSVCVCVSVRLSVGALLFEPFDL